jgi:hypothetical protein
MPVESPREQAPSSVLDATRAVLPMLAQGTGELMGVMKEIAVESSMSSALALKAGPWTATFLWQVVLVRIRIHPPGESQG